MDNNTQLNLYVETLVQTVNELTMNIINLKTELKIASKIIASKDLDIQNINNQIENYKNIESNYNNILQSQNQWKIEAETLQNKLSAYNDALNTIQVLKDEIKKIKSSK